MNNGSNHVVMKVVLASAISALLAILGTVTYFAQTSIGREEVRQLIADERENRGRDVMALSDLTAEVNGLRVEQAQLTVLVAELQRDLTTLLQEQPRKGGT